MGMRRKIKLCMTLLLLLGMIIASKKLGELVISTAGETEQRVVVIDAGHGGIQLRQN